MIFRISSNTKSGPHLETLLHHAIRTGKKPIVTWLLDKGADVNAQDMSGGNTPLHRAVLEGEPDIIELLILNGANKLIKNRRGQTALDIAQSISNKLVREDLVKALKTTPPKLQELADALQALQE